MKVDDIAVGRLVAIEHRTWRDQCSPFKYLGSKYLRKEKSKMPKIFVSIEWDRPADEQWLNADNVAIALHAYCENTHFTVSEVVEPDTSNM